MAVGVPRGYSSRQEWAKAQGMALPEIGLQSTATTQDSGSFGSFTPVIFDNVTKPMRFGAPRPDLQNIAIANEQFSNEGDAADYWKGIYAEKRKQYVDLWNKFDAAGDDDSKRRLNIQYQAMLDLRKKFNIDSEYINVTT